MPKICLINDNILHVSYLFKFAVFSKYLKLQLVNICPFYLRSNCKNCAWKLFMRTLLPISLIARLFDFPIHIKETSNNKKNFNLFKAKTANVNIRESKFEE